MNRRRGAGRFFKKPDLGAIIARLKGLRLPSLSKKNRRRGFFARPASESSTAAADFTRTNSESGVGAELARPLGGTSEGRAEQARPLQSTRAEQARPLQSKSAEQARPLQSTSISRTQRILRGALTFLAFAAPLAAALIAFAVPLLGVRAYEYVMQSGYFHVRSVVVDNAQPPDRAPMSPHLGRDELLKIAGISGDTHVLEADVDTMTKRLVEHPWIRWAKIERELPDRLVVRVVEHRPSAFLAADDLYLIDELGVPFTLAPADLALPLPVFSGIEPDELRDPTRAAALSQRLSSALNLVRIWEGQGLSHRYPIGELRLQPAGGVALILEGRTAGSATEIVLGRGPFREKLFRVEWVLEHLRSIGKTAEYILLDLGDDLTAARGSTTEQLEIGGARVVVKADLGNVDPDQVRTPVDGPAPVPLDVPAPAPANATPPSAPNEITESVGVDVEPEGAEAAPVSGGRPASESGQE